MNELYATTDEEGRFLIPRVPVTRNGYYLSANRDGYVRHEQFYVPSEGPLELMLKTTSRIRLSLELPDGSPAAGFILILEGRPEGSELTTSRDAVSDETGLCLFDGLPAGDYVTYFYGSKDKKWAVPGVRVSDLRKGEEREVSVTAVEGSIFRGRVVDSRTGDPLPQAFIRFWSEIYPQTSSTLQSTSTDKDGSFEFRFPLAPGELTVHITAPTGKDNRVWAKETGVEISSEPVTEVTFRLPDK